MKNIFYVLLTLLLLSSCEEVVDVDLDTAPPRLVVDATIKWEKGTIGNDQTIILTTTTPYFSNEIPVVSNATVFITGPDGSVYDFIEFPDSGMYACSNFVPIINGDYELTVITGGHTYTAQEMLKPVPDIEEIVQNNEGGFTGEDIEIKIFYTDDGTTNDYYLSRFQPEYAAIPDFEVIEDRFFQGNQIFSLFSEDDLEAGQTLDYQLSGISQRYYNYMNILISIA
ncbi:MAG TPA: DUF4249 family protein, partial [Flavobacterium sp.]|nr:DUF4249 family protein [Flavobacterium sp.]